MNIEQTLKGATGDAERQRMTPEGRKEQRDMRLAMADYYERKGDLARARECREGVK